jgi:hypothetical protein
VSDLILKPKLEIHATLHMPDGTCKEFKMAHEIENDGPVAYLAMAQAAGVFAKDVWFDFKTIYQKWRAKQ